MAESKVGILLEVQDRATAGIKNVSNSLDGLKGGLSKMAPTFKTMAVAGTAAFGAVTAAAGLAINAFQEAEVANARLDQIAKQVTKSTDAEIASFKQLATDLQAVGVVADDVIIAGQSQIASFTKSSAVVSSLSKDLADLAVAQYGVNVNQDQAIQTGNLLGKALQGNLGALTKTGIMVSGEFKTAFEAANNEQERAAVLSKIIQDNYGGLNESMRKTSAGGLAALKTSLGDIAENVGAALVPALVTLMNRVKPVVDRIVDWVGKNPKLVATIMAVVAGISGLVAVLGTIGLVLPAIITGVQAVGAVLAVLFSPVGLIIAAVVALGVAIYNIIKYWDEIVAAMQRAIDWVGSVFIGAWNMYWGAYQAIWDGIMNVVDFALAFIQGAFIMFMDAFFPQWREQWEAMQQWFIDIWNTIVTGVQTALTAIQTFFVGVWTKISQWWAQFSKPFIEAWNMIWKGVSDAFASVWEAIKGSFKGAMNWIIDGINKMINAINRLIEGINKVATVGGRLGGGIPKIPNIPMLAQGGIVNRPTLAMIGEGSEPEAVIPLSKLRSMGGGGGVVINITGTFMSEDAAVKMGDMILERLQRSYKF